MSDQFVGEIRMFGLNYAPVNFLPCQGQILGIQQFTALFSLLGTKFGGNGTTNFALPNLQNSVGIGAGQGSGLSPRYVGDQGGVSTVTLNTQEMPAHNHYVTATSDKGTVTASASNLLAQATNGGGKSGANIGQIYSNTFASVTTPMSNTAVGPAGQGQAHDNMMPYLALTFAIAVNGVFPPRP